MKRYAIVRVDDRCPDFFCKYKVMKDEKSISCNDCNLHRKYGDTKEQLVRKVAQELTRQIYKNNFRIKDVAQKIVEFLGVE